MELRDKVVVVTGGAHGIGRAIAERTAAEGAAGVLIADLAGAAAEELAGAIGTRALARRTDVTVEAELAALIRLAEKTWGRLDVMCSNAGGGSRGDLFETANEQWEESFHLNTMAHVWAAKHALPGMLARGEGYFVNTVSAGGLVTGPASAHYTTSKHAAIGFAEWLAIQYAGQGIRVSCICPQAVNTDMVRRAVTDPFQLQAMKEIGTLIEPEQVAESLVVGLRDETFLILPNPEVLTYFQRKASDYDRWLRGMVRLMEKSRAGSAS